MHHGTHSFIILCHGFSCTKIYCTAIHVVCLPYIRFRSLYLSLWTDGRETVSFCHLTYSRNVPNRRCYVEYSFVWGFFFWCPIQLSSISCSVCIWPVSSAIALLYCSLYVVHIHTINIDVPTPITEKFIKIVRFSALSAQDRLGAKVIKVLLLLVTATSHTHTQA